MVFVVNKHGEPLMPTKRHGKVRHLLKDKQAVVHCRRPFTIRLLYDTPDAVEPVELCMDTGYAHIGVSVKTEKWEILSAQFDLLEDEKQRHDDRRKYRRARRNRLRYRAPRFNNRRASKKEGWLAPSIRNKADRHVDLVRRLINVCPVTDIWLEMGSFDTMLLKAIQEGRPLPEGTDYQRGGQYGTETLRAAAFQRDGHQCIFCGRGLKDGAKLHAHHIYYWRGQHGNSLDELATVCEKCHTSANHKEGGILYGYDQKLPKYSGAAFMNTVRWQILELVKAAVPEGCDIRMTYGVDTKLSRERLDIEKSHANDAYAMGRLFPGKRAVTEYYRKRRRNNRILEKFYDARYIDIRDGLKKSGSELGCERTNRCEPRQSDKNLRKYRGPQISKGRRSIRRNRYPLQPGDLVQYEGVRYVVKGTHCNGQRVILEDGGKGRSVACKKVSPIRHAGGWIKTTM